MSPVKKGAREMNPIPSQEEIRRGDTTDVYFARTREVLKKLGKEKVRVTAEGYVKRFPDDYEHAILAGMDEMLSLLAGRNVDVWGMGEGSLFGGRLPLPVRGAGLFRRRIVRGVLRDGDGDARHPLPGLRNRHEDIPRQAAGRRPDRT
jgi:hypothetical protein